MAEPRTLYTIGHSTRTIEQFVALLREHGIELLALGGRRDSEASSSSPNTAWRHSAFRAYADYMATPAFRAALDRLIAEAAARTTVIMCAEAVPWRCHRRLITDALLARGVPVADITGPGAATPARLSEHALVRADGSVIYPAAPGVQEELFA